ncbi:MAG: leucine-rich repeat protein, partial [Bacteroidales bacterium]|nr:leucine-rich repeat protein [Bacteroidales bacterium]
ESVTLIDYKAFHSCRSLETLTISEGIMSIGDEAFVVCALKSITIPGSVKNIGESAFNACHDLVELTLSNGVESIGGFAFANCSSLTSITIPGSVTSIGEYGIAHCQGLKDLTISDGVESIGDCAFANSSIKSLTIPKSVMSIGKGAFQNNGTLEFIYVNEENTKYDSRDNCNAIIETETNTLIAGCINTKIPNMVKTIGSSAFANCNLTKVIIPNGVTHIGDNAFADCSLTNVMLPESITSVGEDAFRNNGGRLSCSAINPPSITRNSFSNWASLVIPCESYEAYSNTEPWQIFSNIECRSLHASDISNIEITDGDVLPTINLSEFFTKAENEEISFEVKSSDDEVVYPALMGNKLGFVQYGTGTATITVTATVEPISMSKSFTFTINPKPDQPEIPCDLSISSEITNATCNSVANGKIELSVSGGTEPYQYKWTTGRTSSGIYNVGAGTYSVLVMDDNGCTAMETFSVNEPSALAIFETPTNPSCGESNGSIDVMTFGGTEPYSYAWKGTTQPTNVVENLSTGTYVLTVTDGNGCTATKTISLSEQNAPSVTLQSVTASKCNEAMGSIEIAVAKGTTPYTYEWSDSSEVANALNRPKMFAGDYTLTVIDGKNCRATLAVTVPPIPFKQPEIALV